MRKQPVLFALVFLTLSLACGPLSAVEPAAQDVEKAVPTLEAVATTASEAGESPPDRGEETVVDEPAQEADGIDFCSLLTEGEITAALGVNSVTGTQHVVEPDLATCLYTLDSGFFLKVTAFATSPARSARNIYENEYKPAFGSGEVAEALDGPWTEGFWNPDVKAVVAVQDDEVVANIQYAFGDDNNRDGLVQLATIFFERLP